MKAEKQKNTYISELAIALADQYIISHHRPHLFSHEREGEAALFLKICAHYKLKLQKYITTFDKILTDAIIQKAIQNTLDKIDEKYANYEAWTSEDMLLLLLQEFVRLFHMEELCALPTNA